MSLRLATASPNGEERYTPWVTRVLGVIRGVYAVMASQQPRAIDGQVEVREILNLTLAIDHDVIDGAPAARFAAELREAIESAAVLTDPVTMPGEVTRSDHAQR